MTRLNQNCPPKMKKRKKDRNIDGLETKRMKLSVKVSNTQITYRASILKFEDAFEGVIKSLKSKKDIQCNGQKCDDTKRDNLETINRRRTDDTMAKRKNSKGQTNIYKTL